MRLFIALDLSREWKDNIKSIQDEIKNHSKKYRLTNVENLHLTLHFLGEVEEETKDLLIEELRTLSYPENLKLSIENLGYFKRRGSKLLWLGCKNTKELQKLYRNLKLILMSLGIEVENRKYTPHITIAREVQIEEESILKISLPEFPTIIRPKLSLYHSRFTKEGVKYSSLYDIK